MTFISSTFKQHFMKKYKIVLLLFLMVLIELFSESTIYRINNKLKDECNFENISSENRNRNRTGTSWTLVKTQPKVKINHKERRKMLMRRRQCTFYDPLINKSNPIFCASQNFVSLVRSKCKTRLGKTKKKLSSKKIVIVFVGNQLSSYAATRYFQAEYGMHPILDPFQTNVINSGEFEISKQVLSVFIFNFVVFERLPLKTRNIDLERCCPSARKRKWKMMMAFQTDKDTGIATDFSTKFKQNPQYYARNFLVGLGPHSTPLFLFKGTMKNFDVH